MNNEHWQLLVIINVYDSKKDTVIFMLDSLQNRFEKKTNTIIRMPILEKLQENCK